MSPSDLESKIRQAADKNRELLSVLSETNNAVPDLNQQRRLIADLERQHADSEKRVDDLESRRRKELRDHERYRDSVMRRFMHKAVGRRDRFDEKAAREEREYFDALQEEQREREVSRNLGRRLAEARDARGPLEREARRREDAQRELDGLYEAVFAGPTSGYPDEDAREREASRALREYYDVRSGAEAESHAVGLLTDAMARMGDSLRDMDAALSHSRMDMFGGGGGGGGTMWDVMERGALRRAESAAREARMLVARARRMSPHVGDLPPVRINHGDLVGDVLFDNVFSDAAFHDEIKKSRASAERCAQALGRSLQDARERHAGLMRTGRDKERRLDETREALQKERERLFEKIAGSRADLNGSQVETAAASASMAKPGDD